MKISLSSIDPTSLFKECLFITFFGCVLIILYGCLWIMIGIGSVTNYLLSKIIDPIVSKLTTIKIIK